MTVVIAMGKVGMDEGGDIHWCEAVVRASSGVWLCIREPKERKDMVKCPLVWCVLWSWYERWHERACW